MSGRGASAGRLDQLGQRPTGYEQLGRVAARPLRREERLAIAPESVEQHRLHELTPLDGKSLTQRGSLLDFRVEQRAPVSLATPKSHEQHPGVRRQTGPGRLDYRVGLRGRFF